MPYKNIHQGWRTIGNKRNYYRSRWEANYARYLQVFKEKKQIHDWEHEPKTFWFEKIKRGVRSYLPDFRVWTDPKNYYYVEVKGYWDQRSRTKVKRFKRYYPHEKLVLRDALWFKENTKNIKLLITSWEM